MPGGEDRLVNWLRERFRPDPRRVPIGIGDDAAAVQLDSSLVVITADMLLDGVHFETQEHSPRQIGRKAIACSLSDCAAMACRPRAATISIALPTGIALDDVRQLADGMAAIADEYACPLVGGDTTSWPGRLAIDVAMLAEPIAPRGPVQRTGARPGDLIYVTGPLGGSRISHHITFSPRLDLAELLAPDDGLHAMMDISDGLALDLHRLCVASGCGAELDADRLEHVISDDARRFSQQDGRSPLEHAVTDGEDFELLVVGADTLKAVHADLTPIGQVASAAQAETPTIVVLHSDGHREPIEPRGYEHLP